MISGILWLLTSPPKKDGQGQKCLSVNWVVDNANVRDAFVLD